MSNRAIHPVLAIALAYPLAAWSLSIALIARSHFNGDPIEPVEFRLAAASLLVWAYLIPYGAANWIYGFREHNKAPSLLVGLLIAWVFWSLIVRLIAIAYKGWHDLRN